MKSLKQIGYFIAAVAGVVGVLAAYYFISFAGNNDTGTNVTEIKPPSRPPDFSKVAESAAKSDMQITREQEERQRALEEAKELERRKSLATIDPATINSILIKKIDTVKIKKKSLLAASSTEANTASNVSAVNIIGTKPKAQPIILVKEVTPRRPQEAFHKKDLGFEKEEDIFNITESSNKSHSKTTVSDESSVMVERGNAHFEQIEAKIMGDQEININGGNIKFRTTKPSKLGGLTIPKNHLFYGRGLLSGDRLKVNITSFTLNEKPIKCNYYMLSTEDMEEGFALLDQETTRQKSSAADNIGSTVIGTATGGLQGVNTLVSEGVNLARIKNNKVKLYEGDKVIFISR